MTFTLVALSIFGIAAPFVFYPIALWLRARIAPSPIAIGDHTPGVDLIICAHNEAESISAKLENALQLDYPRDRLKIWVASDGSTDGTVEIARRFENQGVLVLDLPRRGKAHALAAVAEASRSEVMAFSDANSQWEEGALRALVAPLADAEVGGVAGDQRYFDSTTSIGERSYWSFDRRLKNWQARAGSAISATGAIYAIRRILFDAPPPDATDDFMISTGVIAKGKRLAFAQDAIAFEEPAAEIGGEFRRKVRITTRGLRGIVYRRGLLDPRKTGAYAFELLVHKFWRRMTWLPVLILVLLMPACWRSGGALSLLSFGVASWLILAVAGLSLPVLQRAKPIAASAYILMVNAACAVATFNAIRGRRVALWQNERESELATHPPPPPSDGLP